MDQESYLRPGDNGEPSVLIGRVLLKLKDAVVMTMLHIRQRVIQSLIVFSVVFLLLWIAGFLYGSFYYSYMPRAAFSTPVHYYYRTDCESPASFLCSYPVTNISLIRNKKHVLTFGQAYRISLQLEMPDSPVNQELGMFMIKTACFSRDGGQVASSARSARQLLAASSSRFSMLRYRSDLLRYLGTLLFLPAYLSGAAEQKQVLEVELFSDYTDDPYSPSVTAVIEILSNKVQIYSSQLYVHAHFTGIRYILFNFPLLSALVGVSSNFIFLSLLFILSYMRLLWKVEWVPEQLQTDGLLSDRESVMNNQQEDEGDAAAEVEAETKARGETPEDEEAEELQGMRESSTTLQWSSPHPILSKLMHSSSSTSSCSSVNLSSAESDEVFSEGEDAGSKRRAFRKCRSWKTYLTMMHWSLRRQSSWVQLAGHQGNFQLSDGGEVLKLYSEVEAKCLDSLMRDPLRPFVPQYHGQVTRGEHSYLRLEDLLSGLRRPVIMDCKMGVR
ncbi:uncharacterized protein ABDE67_004267 [Symphorus nematophorus]